MLNSYIIYLLFLSWLHGEFPSPVSSNANSSYSQPPSVGSLNTELFGSDNNGTMPTLHQKVCCFCLITLFTCLFSTLDTSTVK
jgi:hypothetical protein